MGALRGLYYYTSATDPSTVMQVPSTNVNMGLFRGKYVISSGTLANRDDGNQNVIYYGYGTESITNMSYVMTNGTLTQFTLTWNLGSGNRNGGLGTSTNSQVLTISDNSVQITSTASAGQAHTFNVNVASGHTFTVYIFANVNNSAAGQQNGMSLTSNYAVSPGGLTLV